MTTFAGRYEIRGSLGVGGNGTVHRVYDNRIGRELALKLLQRGEDVLVVLEAHALTALESPHILRVFNAGVHEDVPFLATDIAPMGSTEKQIEPGVGVPPVQGVRWVRQALVGLDYCHRRGVLHRDLTPNNIFLDNVDHARLGDFGIAASIGADGTAAPAGNQHCRAPEGYGGRLTPLSDIFSAGTTLWRLLTGEWPYEAQYEADLAEKMRTSDRPRLRDVAPHVHRSIADVVEMALSPEPSERPASANEMARLLADARVHDRNWTRVKPDGCVDRFVSTDGGATIVVTVSAKGSAFEIDTRHLDSDRRLTAGCLDAGRRQLPVALRRVFDRVV